MTGIGRARSEQAAPRDESIHQNGLDKSLTVNRIETSCLKIPLESKRKKV